MKLKTEPTVLNNILALNLDINIWSARRKLKPEDFQHAQLPPEQLVSLGSKKIANPQDLKIFGTLKSRAVALLDKVGIRFLGGWAIPESKAIETIDALQAIADEFYTAKATFMQNYGTSIQSWIDSNPGWESVIAQSAVSAGYVEKRIAFNWQTFKVAAPSGKQQLKQGLHAEVETLGSTLFDEVAKVARTAWAKSYEGKHEITRKALSPIKNIYAKLEGLNFVEPRVMPVAELIEASLAKLPPRKPIRGTDLLMIKQLITMLASPNQIVQYAQEMIEGRSKDNIIDSLINAVPERKKRTKQLTIEEPEPQTAALQLDSCGLW